MLDGILFKNHMESDEKLRMIVHKHWFVGAKQLAIPVVSFCFSLYVILQQISGAALYVVAAWFLLSLVWVARNFFDYYLDAWLITDSAVIDLEWLGWFHRQSTRVLYSDVQGVSYEIAGIMATIFRYGTVSVEKISTGAVVELPYVHQPRRVEATILKNMEAYLHKKNLKNATHVQDLLANFVAQQMQAKDIEHVDDSEDESA